MTIMTTLPPAPFAAGGIVRFGERMRGGEITAAYLTRIEILDPRLGAYQHVAVEPALAATRQIDKRLAGGQDAGPLMGCR